jgi:hypothetical protein
MTNVANVTILESVITIQLVKTTTVIVSSVTV